MKDNRSIVVHILFRFDIGGMEQVLVDTVDGLKNEFRHVVVTLTTATTQSICQLPADVDVVQLRKEPGNDFSLWLKIYRLLRHYRADILHTYNIGTVEYHVAGFFARVPVRIHAEHGRDFSDPGGTNLKYLCLRKVMRLFIHRWVAVSADLERWLQSSVGVSKDDSRLIRNGVDIKSFVPRVSSRHARGAYWPEGLRASSIYVIVTVARLDPVKNQLMLLAAFALMKGHERIEDRELMLAIIGDGPSMASLRARAHELGIDNFVWFAGSRYDIQELLSEADLFVLSSDAEGIPITLLEAMSTEVPVVVTAVGGIPEVVDETMGIIVPAGDVSGLSAAMLDCYFDRSAAMSRASRGREVIVKKFSKQAMVSAYRSVYRQS